MKTLAASWVIFSCAICISTSAKASAMRVNHETNPANDTVLEVKGNVVLFKLITPPIPANNSNSGSLKKAGKVARTSYSHTTSIDNIMYKKKGI